MPYPYKKQLNMILSGHTELNQSGYPIISQESFRIFRDDIPHLFRWGSDLLVELDRLKARNKSTANAIRVLQTMTRTAAITSPPDLWLMRFMVDTYKRLGILDHLKEKGSVDIVDLENKFQLNPGFLTHDLDFLVSRRFLLVQNQQVQLTDVAQTQTIISNVQLLASSIRTNHIPLLVNFLNDGKSNVDAVTHFLNLPSDSASDRDGWAATLDDIEIGFRILPFVLALRSLNINSKLTRATKIFDKLAFLPELECLLSRAGYIDSSNQVTALGERVFQRGSGAFGIIHAYYPYMENHLDLVKGLKKSLWVARGENVAASQDANAKTFERANDSLDQYCKDTGFQIKVFIEHAVGQGEATRQRFERSKNQNIQYFGADLENEAVIKARESQAKGQLPANMIFISGIDIAKPKLLANVVQDSGFTTNDAVMMVGNGFHEVRNQTNESMIEVFRGYCEAGMILIFTEETALTNEDLLATAWNTYHAGFRYVHAISGQGLRPARERDDVAGARYSWQKCATLGGYNVLEKYMSRTRTIYPHPRQDGYNPAISVNYFCVPK